MTELVLGEACHADLDICLKTYNETIGEIAEGIRVQVYAKTKNKYGNPCLTILLLEAGSLFLRGAYYTGRTRDENNLNSRKCKTDKVYVVESIDLKYRSKSRGPVYLNTLSGIITLPKNSLVACEIGIPFFLERKSAEAYID